MALDKSLHITVVLLPLQLSNRDNFSLQDKKKCNFHSKKGSVVVYDITGRVLQSTRTPGNQS